MTWIENGRWERWLVAAILLEFLALIAIRLLAIPMHVSFNYNEGWNAYFAQNAMGAGVLYPPADSMFTNNYPPLSFYIVGAFGRVVGDNIVAGRLIAVLALTIVAFNVSMFGRWLGADKRLAALSSGVFLLGVYAVMPDYIGINDPQFLAYAWVTSAAVVFLKTPRSHMWLGMSLSALLMALGGLIKHSEISLPLALCIWAAFHDRPRLVRFLVCALVIGAVVAASAYAGWGGEMVNAIFWGARMTVFWKILPMVLRDIPFVLPYLILSIIALAMGRRNSHASFVLIYLVWSLLIGCWMLSDYGVNQNVMCDAVIALALGAVLMVMAMADPVKRVPLRHLRRRAPALLLMTLPCMGAAFFVYSANPSLRDTADIMNAPKWDKLYKTLAASHGEVACETLAVCYWAGKPMTIDFYNYGLRVLRGDVYVDASGGFYDKINHKDYAHVELEAGALPRSRLPRVLIDAVFKNYKPVQSMGDTVLVMVPKS